VVDGDGGHRSPSRTAIPQSTSADTEL